MKSLKQHLQDVSEIRINIKPDTSNVKAEHPAVKCETQPSLPSEPLDNGSQPTLQTSGPSGFTTSEPVTAGMSATASRDATMEEDSEKPEADMSMDCTVGPEANKDLEKVKRDEESTTSLISTANVTSAASSGNTAPAASRPAPPATALMPEGSSAELPQINKHILKVLRAAVHQHRLTRGNTTRSEENMVRPGFKSQP